MTTTEFDRLERRLERMRMEDGLVGFSLTVGDPGADREAVCAAANATLDFAEGARRGK